MRTPEPPDNLDPRRHPRGAAARRRDWASSSRVVPVPSRLGERLMTLLTRLGLVR